jgi:predicted RNA-binding protein with PIN domain
MPLIIDGWNFIRSDASDIKDEESLEGARILIAYLERFQRTHGDPIILVFDSSSEFLDISYHNSPKLTIVPSRDADTYIKRYVDNTPERQRPNVRVVSSDKSIYFYARDSRATPVRSDEFWRTIYRDSQRRETNGFAKNDQS